MDLKLSALLPATSTFICLCLVIFLWASRLALRKNSRKNAPPEARGAWPIIGHLPLLGGPKPAYRILGDMADKFGPIFTIKLGVRRALVVSNWETAKECFTTHDKAFANRPTSLVGELLGYNFAMVGFSMYGPYWRHVRKIAAQELLSNRRIQMLRHVRESEVKASIKETYELWAKNRGESTPMVLLEMKNWFGKITSRVIFRAVVGNKWAGDVECEKAIKEFMDWAGAFVLSDALPFLRWLDLGGSEKSMKKIAKKLDQMLEKCLEDHRQKAAMGEGKEEYDLMDAILSFLDQDTEEVPTYDANTIIKATCLALILGGSDTTSVTLTWALSWLLNNKPTMKKAQDELDIVAGRERQVNESDIKNLVYLQAIVKETLRLNPPPLSVPHESMEECIVGGYHIPPHTRLLVNASKIQRDPLVWAEPGEFRPERFLDKHKDLDVRGHNFEYMPFGSGRRICPGITFALHSLSLILASLLHGFEMSTLNDEPVDMSDTPGINNDKATPLEVLLSPRLSPHLYAQCELDN